MRNTIDELWLTKHVAFEAMRQKHKSHQHGASICQPLFHAAYMFTFL